MNKRTNPPIDKVLLALARSEGFAPGRTGSCREDEQRLWSLLDGELPEAQEEALLGHLQVCGACATRIRAILEARKAIAAEEGWSFERAWSLIAQKAGLEPADSAPGQIIGRIFQLGRQTLTLLTAGFDALEPAPAMAFAAVRGEQPPPSQAEEPCRWIGQYGRVRLGLRFVPSTDPDHAGALSIERLDQAPPEETESQGELELMAEPGEALETVALRDLPARMELPFGKAWLSLSVSGGKTRLLEWDVTRAKA